MARAQFERDEVINKSIDLFWQHGFSGSSMQQVVKTTGLKPGSIYHSFGNKEALFREALEAYTLQRIAMIIQLLDEAESVGEGICTLLDKMIFEATKKNYCSCFLIKTQLELAHEDNDLQELASQKLADVKKVLLGYLEKEYGTKKAKIYATSVVLHIYGIRVYGYQKDATDAIKQGVRVGLPWLPWDK